VSCRPLPNESHGAGGEGTRPLVASTTFAELAAPDVVVINGHTRFDNEPDERVVQWLRQGPPHHHLDDERVTEHAKSGLMLRDP